LPAVTRARWYCLAKQQSSTISNVKRAARHFTPGLSVSNFCGPSGNVIEPGSGERLQKDMPGVPSITLDRPPAWTRLELAVREPNSPNEARVTDHDILRRHSQIRIGRPSRDLSPLPSRVAWNGAERSRARPHLARRSGPLTARTVPRESGKRGKILRKWPGNNLTRTPRISWSVTHGNFTGRGAKPPRETAVRTGTQG